MGKQLSRRHPHVRIPYRTSGHLELDRGRYSGCGMGHRRRRKVEGPADYRVSSCSADCAEESIRVRRPLDLLRASRKLQKIVPLLDLLLHRLGRGVLVHPLPPHQAKHWDRTRQLVSCPRPRIPKEPYLAKIVSTWNNYSWT